MFGESQEQVCTLRAGERVTLIVEGVRGNEESGH